MMPGQTTIDLRSQARNVDFSNAAATKVWKTGTGLPASCNVGEGYFLTSATAGQNLYLCTASGIWKAAGPAPLPFAGLGTNLQSVGGTFAPNAVPVIDATNTQVSSGCTAVAGSMTCTAGFSSGSGATRITASEGGAPTAPPAGEQTLYIDSADHNLKALDSGSVVRQYATLGGAETLGSKTLTNPSLGGSALTSTFLNEGTTGTVLGKLAKLTGNPAAAVLVGSSDAGGAVGIVTGGAGATGSAEVATAGQATCVFDGATAAGDYVSISATVAGDCHDNGSAYPSSGQILGRVLSTNASGGTYPMILFGPEMQGGTGSAGRGVSGGSSSFDPLDESTVWVRDEMIDNSQWAFYADTGGVFVSGDPTYGDPAHPGVFQMNTGANAGYGATISLAWPNSAYVMHYPQGQVWEMRWVIRIGNVSGAYYEFGFNDNGNHDGLRVTYNPLLGSNWFGASRSGDSDTIVDLQTPAVSSAWAKIRMRSDMTKVYFSVNGGAEKTICPSGCDVTGSFGLGGGSQVYPYASVRSQTSASAALGVDFFAMQISGVSR